MLGHFNVKILNLNESLKKLKLNCDDINMKLDDLNATICLPFDSSSEENLNGEVVNCCTSIPTNNSLLVAKTCNLLLNYVRKQKKLFSNLNLVSILKWINDATHQSSDIAYLDILQALNSLIKTHSEFFAENGGKLVPVLFEELELLTSVLQPIDVKLWRILCLQSLAKNMLKEDKILVINELLKIVNSQSPGNAHFHAKQLKIIFETFGYLCSKGSTKWLTLKLDEIMNLVMLASVFGLQNSKQIISSPINLAIFPIPKCTNSNNITISNPEKKKKKVKQVDWSEKDSFENQHMQCFDVYQTGSITSDSDISDNENGHAINESKELSRARHATYNFLIRLTNVLKWKQLIGYHIPLFNSLILCLQNEGVTKVKIALMGAIASLLLHSKPFFAQAQHCEGTPFMAFSESLSEIITNLHFLLGSYLRGNPPFELSVPLLHMTATLISVSPYYRLKHSLLPSIYYNLEPYLRHKDPDVSEGSLRCLNGIVCIQPSIPEQNNILKGLKQVDAPSTFYWILSEIKHFLENSFWPEKVRLVCWEIVGSLCKLHFHIIQENIKDIEKMLFSNLSLSKIEEQTQVVMALNTFLEQIIGKSDLEIYNKQLWTKILDGPLIALLQSPDVIASEACDCLANMGPIVFNNLQQSEKILVITLLFGCVDHENAKVRTAAVHSLGIFLLFPQLAQEQFIFDISDLLEKSLSDSCLAVRIKSAWAFGNLLDLLVNYESEELLIELNLKKILSTCLLVISDDEMVRSNLLRAVGHILFLFKKEDFQEILCKEMLDKSVQFFLNCTSLKTKMKTRWNACYAIGSMLKNEDVFNFSEKWMGAVINTLSKLILSCNNFKVRVSACTALSHITSRVYFGVHYLNVYTILLDGLENAANMTDFREYKHQDSLKQHLCMTICHLITLLLVEDIVEIEKIMNLRMENLKQHFIYFQNNTPPEKTGIMVNAANHIQCLLNHQGHKDFLNKFVQMFLMIHT